MFCLLSILHTTILWRADKENFFYLLLLTCLKEKWEQVLTDDFLIASRATYDASKHNRSKSDTFVNAVHRLIKKVLDNEYPLDTMLAYLQPGVVRGTEAVACIKEYQT